MGVSCAIVLPYEARSIDIAKIIGMSCGLPFEMKQLGQVPGTYLNVEGVTLRESAAGPTCGELCWQDLDGTQRHVLWHYEFNPNSRKLPRGRGMLPPSTAFWICIGKRLVDFFGGWVDFNDCDSQRCDYWRKMNHQCDPEDGKPWQDQQFAMASILPISADEFEAALPHAASAYRWPALDLVQPLLAHRVLKPLAA